MTALAFASSHGRPGVAFAALMVLTCAATPALSVDLGPLRGSQTYGTSVVKWQGGYFGGAVGYSNLRAEGDGAVERLIARDLRNTTVENEMRVSTFVSPDFEDARETTYGVFAGYNFQFAETVLGLELDFTRGGLSASGTDTLSRFRVLSDNYRADATATGTVAVELKNLATLRARAGYTIGAFLPFVTAGLAMAEYESSTVASTVIGFDSHPTLADFVYVSGPLRDSTSSWAFGLAAGAGVDVALTENVFLRGEWQYVYLPDVAGGQATLNTVRGAAGVRF